MPVYTGATAVLLYRFDPLGVAQALERHRVTWWYSIAPMNGALMQVPGARDLDWSALRRNPVTSFGITFTEALAQQCRIKLGVHRMQGLGDVTRMCDLVTSQVLERSLFSSFAVEYVHKLVRVHAELCLKSPIVCTL